MNAYPQVPLGEICTVNPRKRKLEHSVEDAVVSFVPMAAVDERFGTITVREERPLSDVSKGFTAFENGDVLFAKITPCMENGKIALARNLTNGVGRGSTEFFVLRPSDRVLGEYIYHFLRQLRFREAAKESFTGTAGQQRVPKSFMENALVPLPTLDEQQRIVGILNRAARTERLRVLAANRLREFISALYIKMFGDHEQIGRRFPCGTTSRGSRHRLGRYERAKNRLGECCRRTLPSCGECSGRILESRRNQDDYDQTWRREEI